MDIKEMPKRAKRKIIYSNDERGSVRFTLRNDDKVTAFLQKLLSDGYWVRTEDLGSSIGVEIMGVD